MSYLCLNCQIVSEPGPYKSCPNCGDTGIPANTEITVTITLTFHELRILTMWAEFYSTRNPSITSPKREQMQRVVYGITDRLLPQLPVGAAPLTFQGELADLNAEFGPVETNYPDPPPPLESRP